MGTAPRQSHTYLSTIGDKGGDLTLDGHVAGVLQTAERTHYQPPTGNWGLVLAGCWHMAPWLAKHCVLPK